VTEFLVAGATPGSLAAAPDGSVWFTDTDRGAVGHLGPDGTVRAFPLAGNRHAVGIAAAPDGDIWFTQYSGYRPAAPSADPSTGPAAIGHLTPEGSMTEFPLPTQQANPMGVADMGSSPTAIVAGPDGAMWFTEMGADQIGRINAEGLITEYPLPDRNRRHANPEGITVGPDGAIWFTEALTNQLGRIDPATGSITEFPTFTNAAQRGISQSVAAGADGDVWFDNINAAVIGHMTTAGKATVERLPDGRYKPTALVPGPDGKMWFFDQQKPAIVRLSAQGQPADVVSLPGGSNQYVFGTALAADGGSHIWFAEPAAKKIGRIDCGRPAA
jgi:virginiamycin B lyase